jgi:hypothetical protein
VIAGLLLLTLILLSVSGGSVLAAESTSSMKETWHWLDYWGWEAKLTAADVGAIIEGAVEQYRREAGVVTEYFGEVGPPVPHLNAVIWSCKAQD